MKSKTKRWLLGLGTDEDDGHIRVTKGEHFYLTGGSHRTHASMREKVVKFTEAFKHKGTTIEEASDAEILEVAHTVGFKNFTRITQCKTKHSTNKRR